MLNNLRLIRQDEGPLNIKRHKFHDVLDDAVAASVAITAEAIEYHGIQFQNTAKWIVAFLGSQKGLYNLDGMVHTHPSVNLLIICMMNSETDKENIKDVKELISKTNEGGFMIVRCKLDNEV